MEVEDCIRTNVEGTQRLAQSCREIGIPRFVFASTIAAYGRAQMGAGSRWTEQDALQGTTPYAQSKIAGETAVRAIINDWRVLRIATVYGPGDRANFARLAGALRRRRFVLPGQGGARKSVIALEDVAEVLAAAALRDDLEQVVMNLAAPPTPSLAEICEAFCSHCGFHLPPRWPIPLLRTLAKMGDGVKAVTGRSPLTSETLTKLTESTVADTAILQRLFPTHPWKSFGESLRDCAGYYASL